MKLFLVMAMLAICTLATLAADQLAFTPTMKYLSPTGYARLRLYNETGIWEDNPLAEMQSDSGAYTQEYGYLSTAGAARVSIYQRFGVWLSADEALVLCDFGDDTFSFHCRMDDLAHN